MDNTRYCPIQGHQNGNTSYVCTYKQCKLSYRWLCSACIMNDLHKHDKSNRDHIMNMQQFLDHITKLTQPYVDWNLKQRNMILECANILKKYQQKICQFVHKLQDDYARISVQENIQEINKIIHIIKNNFHLLQNDQIDKVLNINIGNLKIDYKISLELLKEAIVYQKDLQKLIQNKQQGIQQKEQLDKLYKTQFSQNIVSQNIDQRYASYISYKSDDIKRTAQISNDEKFLVIGGEERQLQIIGLETKKNLKCLQLEEYVMISRFTNDSKTLLCGSRDGQLCCFDLNSYQEIYKNNIHSQQINDIVPIDNQLIITCSTDKSIIVTDIGDKKQVLQISNTQSGYFKGLDFDLERDIIAACSDDNSIKLFDRQDGRLLIDQQNAHKNQVFQIQLLTPGSNLISSGCNDLILWQIDYAQSQLFKLEVLNQHNYNFTSICDNQKIVLICKENVQILDNNLNVIDIADHNIKDFGYYAKIKQSQSANYIIILGQCTYIIIIRHDTNCKENMRVLKSNSIDNIIIIQKMAIVVRSDKEASFIQKQSVNVGPGDYEIEFKKSKIFHLPRINNRSPLPKKQLPGPGQYLVEETMPTLQPNSVFKSETNRFNEPQNKIVPGPGTYDLQQRSHTEKKQEYKPKLIEQLMYAGLYQSINSIPFNKNPDRKLGPGQYEMKSSFDIPKQEKCITQNVSKVELQQDLGPGYYDIEKYYQKKITQNRKSKASTRSNSRQYVKQGLNKKIYFSFHETEDESEYEYIEDATPGPGSYEQQSFITSRISRQTQQCQERFKTLSNIAPGPGQYNPKPLTNNIQIKFGKDDRLKYPKVQIQPSAADYNNPLTLEQQMVKKLQRASLGYFGVRDNRFNSIQDNIPGPGSYNNSEIKVEKQQQSYQFRSTSNRELQTISDVPPVGEYEINDTIANKLQKELELIKEINIKKQPFNVGDKRFKEEIIKEESEEDIPEKLPNKRFMKIKRKKSPPFNTNVNFYQFQELRFREKIEQSPRPTDYQMNDQWLKRSYNLIYLNLK